LAIIAASITILGTALEALPLINKDWNRNAIVKNVRISKWYASAASVVYWVVGSDLAYASLHNAAAEMQIDYGIGITEGNYRNLGYGIGQGENRNLKPHDRVSISINGEVFTTILESQNFYNNGGNFSDFNVVVKFDSEGTPYKANLTREIKTYDGETILETENRVNLTLFGEVCAEHLCDF